MRKRFERGAVAALALLVVALITVDVVRQLQLGVADPQLGFFAASIVVAVVASLAVGRRRAGRRMAALMLIWLALSVLGDFGLLWPMSRLAATVFALAFALQPASYCQMILAYPGGRLRDRVDRAFMAAAFLVCTLWAAAMLLTLDLRGCSDCSPRVPSLLFIGSPGGLDPVWHTRDALFIALGLMFVALIVRRLQSAPSGAWITLVPLAAAAVFATANFVVERAATLADWTTPFTVIGWLDTANTLILPVAIFVGIGSINRRRGPLGDLMVELSSTPAGEVGPALARSLGDPTLTLALWLPDRRVFVDERGVEVQLPREQLGRAVTLVGSEPAPLAAIVHDDRLLDQQALLEAAGSAATLALENTRLQAELRAQLAELKASRARVVSSADAERRRVERDLHDGAQQRLLALGLALQLLRDRGGDSELLGDAERELHAALAELRDLARGIHPAILTEQGLAPAIRSLVDRTAMPVRVNLEEGRFAQEVETAAYFFVSEALANVSKHAEATTAAVTVARSNGNLVIEVADDGRGGATSSGSGLQGLADRVGALDGRLAIESDEGRGTIIRAEIPCASS